MNVNNALWEKGDYRGIMDFGHATAARPAARLGVNVPCVDSARSPLEAGSKRVQDNSIANSLNQEDDVSGLSKQADDAFDVVLSILGATMIW